jgi:hypothetical protein
VQERQPDNSICFSGNPEDLGEGSQDTSHVEEAPTDSITLAFKESSTINNRRSIDQALQTSNQGDYQNYTASSSAEQQDWQEDHTGSKSVDDGPPSQRVNDNVVLPQPGSKRKRASKAHPSYTAPFKRLRSRNPVQEGPSDATSTTGRREKRKAAIKAPRAWAELHTIRRHSLREEHSRASIQSRAGEQSQRSAKSQASEHHLPSYTIEHIDVQMLSDDLLFFNALIPPKALQLIMLSSLLIAAISEVQIFSFSIEILGSLNERLVTEFARLDQSRELPSRKQYGS